MTQRSDYRRNRSGGRPAQKEAVQGKTQQQADFLTFQMIAVILLLAVFWAAKFFQWPFYDDIRRLEEKVRTGDPAVVSELTAAITPDAVIALIDEKFGAGLSIIGRSFSPLNPPTVGVSQYAYDPANPDAPDTVAAEENKTPALKRKTIAMGGVFPDSFEALSATPPRGATFSPLLLSAPPRAPLSGVITSPFGWRDNPLSPGSLDFHTGLDIAAPEGAIIFASLPGTVEDTGYSESYGNYVLVSHANGLQTYYCHCSEIIVRTGEVIRQGERLARVGSTGNVTGPHLHFEIRQNSLSNDPLTQLASFFVPDESTAQ